MDVTFRCAAPGDAPLLARMNGQLIRDEGHRNRMTPDELEQRMAGWLGGEYHAVIFESGADTLGYALYRREMDYVYLRQFFVWREYRRRGVGRSAIEWLARTVWSDVARVRLDVLVGNPEGRAFWQAVGFHDYCVTMELSTAGGGDDSSPSVQSAPSTSPG
jgi:GNAT superfamily N-acetyltransferase